MIRNCPVTVKDIEIAEDIWGKDISYMKEKTTRSRPDPVRREDTMTIPKEITEKHQSLSLKPWKHFISFMSKTNKLRTLILMILFSKKK